MNVSKLLLALLPVKINLYLFKVLRSKVTQSQSSSRRYFNSDLYFLFSVVLIFLTSCWFFKSGELQVLFFCKVKVFILTLQRHNRPGVGTTSFSLVCRVIVQFKKTIRKINTNGTLCKWALGLGHEANAVVNTLQAPGGGLSVCLTRRLPSAPQVPKWLCGHSDSSKGERGEIERINRRDWAE